MIAWYIAVILPLTKYYVTVRCTYTNTEEIKNKKNPRGLTQIIFTKISSFYTRRKFFIKNYGISLADHKYTI